MKNLLFLSLSLALTSCASIDGLKKSPNCTVWRDQEFWGPYSIEVVENKVLWDSNCKMFKPGCVILSISMDENKNVLTGESVLGKIENNELRFVDNHALSAQVNFTAVQFQPELKIVKSSITENSVMREEPFQYNDKCTPEAAIVGAVALSTISKMQKK